MENRNREMPEEKHSFGPSWKLPHDLKVGIWEINTFSAKSESSCRNYHPLWKPELRKRCQLLLSSPGEEHTHPPAARPTAQGGGPRCQGWEGGSRQLKNGQKETTQGVTPPPTEASSGFQGHTLVAIPHPYSCKMTKAVLHLVLIARCGCRNFPGVLLSPDGGQQWSFSLGLRFPGTVPKSN